MHVFWLQTSTKLALLHSKCTAEEAANLYFDASDIKITQCVLYKLKNKEIDQRWRQSCLYVEYGSSTMLFENLGKM